MAIRGIHAVGKSRRGRPKKRLRDIIVLWKMRTRVDESKYLEESPKGEEKEEKIMSIISCLYIY